MNEAWKAVSAEYERGTFPIQAFREISDYATETHSETVAEAFNDVFSNGITTQPLSREIVKNIKRRLAQMYDISGFFDWLNEIPDSTDIDFPTFAERGIKENAPESAKRAFEQYLKDKKEAKAKGIML